MVSFCALNSLSNGCVIKSSLPFLSIDNTCFSHGLFLCDIPNANILINNEELKSWNNFSCLYFVLTFKVTLYASVTITDNINARNSVVSGMKLVGSTAQNIKDTTTSPLAITLHLHNRRTNVIQITISTKSYDNGSPYASSNKRVNPIQPIRKFILSLPNIVLYRIS